ncbi:MAG: sugar-transfer associated ATP-grasp domain-containing protein [Eubacterium sp.]|nr:sugar-transfer associated ATP-grasp domain-containing protein [Eubacterium sp.]
MLKLIKKTEKRLKLILLYFRRILFAKNNFKVSFFTKMKANLFGGYLADQYVIYDFKHNDKNEYLSEFDWYRSRYINEPFEPMMNNKIIAEEVLKQYISTPKNLCYKNKGLLTSKGEKIREYEQVYELLQEYGSLFIKPFGKGKGMGVYRFDYTENGAQIDGKDVTKEEFCQFVEKQDEWVICETAKQSKFLDNIYDKTTNTIRFITMRNPETNLLEVFFAVLRIGTKETIPVDNGSRGGLVCNINLETGELSEARCLHNMGVHTHHPDSNNPIKGQVIPNWHEIKEQVLDVAREFPYFHFIAWDLLLTDDGVTVIEANNSSGVNIIQLWGGQRQGKLGDFYRAHNAIKK